MCLGRCHKSFISPSCVSSRSVMSNLPPSHLALSTPPHSLRHPLQAQLIRMLFILSLLPPSLPCVLCMVLRVDNCWKMEGGLEFLALLANLEVLGLKRCLGLKPGGLDLLTQLKTLDVSYTSLLNEGMKPLSLLTGLEELTMQGLFRIREGFESLAYLTNLRVLNCEGCRNLRGDLASLTQLTSLESVNLGGCGSLSGMPVSGLYGALPGCVVHT